MNIYIWERVSAVTGEWHSGGGVVIAAASLAEARAIWEREISKYPVAEVDGGTVLDTEPNAVYPLADVKTETAVYVFPDAGCC